MQGDAHSGVQQERAAVPDVAEATGRVVRPVFPAELQSVLLASGSREQGVADVDALLASLEAAAGRLSDLFTTDRSPGFDRYWSQPDLRSAYNLFFFPQTFVRTQMVLAELLARQGWQPPADRPVRILDLGAGTGAAGLAALHLLSLAFPGVSAWLRAVDRSTDSLREAEAVFAAARSLWPTAQLEVACGDLLRVSACGDGWDLAIVSFSLNEAVEGRSAGEAVAWAGEALRVLAPGGRLVIIEPATREACERLEQLRDEVLSAQPVGVFGPCLHASACPLRASGAAWCHEVRRWTVPECVERLNRRLFREVNVLKFGFLVLGPGAPPPAGTSERARLVSPLTARKGLARAFGCAADGQVHAYEAPLRGASRADHDALDGIERGDIVEWPQPRVLGDGRTLRSAVLPRKLFGF